MVKYYRMDPERAATAFPRNIAQQLIGSDERRRVPKSYMPTLRIAILLTRVANHYRRLAYRLIVLHERDTRPRDKDGSSSGPGEVLTFDEAMDRYPSIRTWKEFHDWCAEHLGALTGFTTLAAVRAEGIRRDELRMQGPAIPESSARDGQEREAHVP